MRPVPLWVTAITVPSIVVASALASGWWQPSMRLFAVEPVLLGAEQTPVTLSAPAPGEVEVAILVDHAQVTGVFVEVLWDAGLVNERLDATLVDPRGQVVGYQLIGPGVTGLVWGDALCDPVRHVFVARSAGEGPPPPTCGLGSGRWDLRLETTSSLPGSATYSVYIAYASYSEPPVEWSR